MGERSIRSAQKNLRLNTNLAEFAHSMEPAKAFQVQIAKLAKTFEAVGELQSQFLELSETFRVASRSGDGLSSTTAHN